MGGQSKGRKKSGKYGMSIYISLPPYMCDKQVTVAKPSPGQAYVNWECIETSPLKQRIILSTYTTMLDFEHKKYTEVDTAFVGGGASMIHKAANI